MLHLRAHRMGKGPPRAVLFLACLAALPLLHARPAPTGQAAASAADAPATPGPARFVEVCLSDSSVCSPVVAVRPVPGGWALDADTVRALGLDALSNGQVVIPEDQARFDPVSLQLVWDLPLAARPAQALTRSHQAVLPGRLDQGFSAQLAYSVGLDTAARAFAGATLTAGAGNTWLTASGFAYGSTFRPGLAQVSHLRPQKAQRIVAGEQVVGSPDILGGAALLRGVSWRRDFSLRPDLSTLPAPAVSGILSQPGVVEVYRNGVLVGTTPVSPGPYEWGGLPLGTGTNDLDVVFRGADGSRQSLGSPGFTAQPGALAQGLADFAFSAGVVDGGHQAWQGWVRRGFPRAITAGVRAEGQGSRTNAGAFAQGTFGPVAVSASLARDDAGAAGHSLAASFARGPVHAQAFAWRTDPTYWRLGDDDRLQLAPGARAIAASGLSAGFSHGNFAHALRAERRELVDGSSQSMAGVSSSWYPDNGWRWSLSAQAHDGLYAQRTVSLSVSVPLSPRASVSAQAQAGTRPTQSVQYNRRHDGAFGTSLSAFARHDATATLAGGHVARATPMGTARLDGYAGTLGSHAQATWAGSLAWVDGQVRAGSARPGGAVLVKVPGHPNAMVRVNHHDAGTAGPDGVLVDGLSANTPVSISIDPDTLPLSADLARSRTAFLASGLGVAVVELSPVPAQHRTWLVRVAGPEGQLQPAHRGILVLDGQRVLVGTTGLVWLPADADLSAPATWEGPDTTVPCSLAPDRTGWDCPAP